MEKNKNPDFKNLVQKLKKLCEDSGAGQAACKLKGSGLVGGWNIAIIVQEPGFQPEKGDIKICF